MDNLEPHGASSINTKTNAPKVIESGERITFAPDVKCQSGTTDDVSIMKMASAQSENVRFSDQHDPYLYDVDRATDPTRTLMDTNDATLDRFFSRPLKIHEEEWGTGTVLYFNIDPWSLYMENPRVINRITTYNLLRSVLKLKLVINGNGFQYGRAIASYLPYEAFDSLSTNAALVPEDIVQASQQPHVYLNPTTSTGGELALPFFYHKNYLHVPDNDWGDLGTLTVRSINELKHANGAADKVTISVFAWIEEVSMNVLTSVDPSTLVAQSGNASEVDEANMKGTISGPATAVKKMANVAKTFPPIAPFASATEVIAGATATVAKHFGYCKPPITKAPDPYRPTPTSTLSIATTPDVVQKLTVDDKQELSIDPRITGLGNTDAMNIKEIAKRESYLTSFTWTMGTAPESLLWNARVDPVTWAEDGLTPNGYHFPACCMAALPFKYWTGSMKFRFQIVASAFHKGRIKIVYDPNFLSSNEYNTNYLEVVDIAEKSDFTIEIGNGQETSLLEHHDPNFHGVTQLYSTTTYTGKEEGNGVVGVYVVNELTTPNSTTNNDIEINVFVSMGDDFEVFVPDDSFQSFVVAQSGDADQVPESFNTDEPDAPQQSKTEQLGPGLTNHDMLGRVYTGESIQSFRTLLKRYNLHTSIVDLPTGTPVLHKGRMPMFPFLRGSVSGAVHLTSTSTAYNYCNTVLLHWVTCAFSGWRGSIRWKIIPRNPGSPNSDKIGGAVQRAPEGEIGYYYSSGAAPTFGANTAPESVITQKTIGGEITNAALSGTRGLAYFHDKVNPTIEFEVPYYSAFRFKPGKTADHTSVLLAEEGFDYQLWTYLYDSCPVDFWCAAGEDFQTYFWTGLPRMYREGSPPTPL